MSQRRRDVDLTDTRTTAGNPVSDDPGTEPDPLVFLDSMQPFLEHLRGMVAVFVADGFTEDQARELTVCAFRFGANNQ